MGSPRSLRTWLSALIGAGALLTGAGAAHAADPMIAAAGDIACGVSAGSGCKQMETSNLIFNRGYDAVLPLGDLQYNCMTPADVAYGYEPSWGRFKNITKPTPGNHEYWKKNSCDPLATGYYSYFSGVPGLPPAATDPTRGYYSYDIGDGSGNDWHLIALNTGEDCREVSCAAGSEQVNWLKADLAAHPNVCTIAYFHYPRFSSNTPLPQFTQPLWDALYAGGADIVLSGHVHHYERFAPQTPSGFPDPAFGIRQFNVGTGGIGGEGFKKLTPLDPSSPLWDPLGPPQQYTYAPNSEVRLSTYGVLKLTLHPTTYDWEFVDTGRQSSPDTGTGTCHGKPGNTDTTPPRVSVTSPRANASVFGTVNLAASATDNVRVASVTFSVDGVQIGQPDTSSAYGVPLDTTKLANGPHTVRAMAFDSTGNQATSAPVTITVDNDQLPPSVRLTSPATNAIVTGQVALSATAVDNPGGKGVQRVEFLVDGTVVATDTSSPYTATWNSTKVKDGVHPIAARAVDVRGNVSTFSQTSVLVQNVIVAGPGSTSIASLALTGTTPTIIAKAINGSLADPAYSHAGTRLAYTSPDGIVVANANGSDRRLIPGTKGAARPGWGVKDTTLIFMSTGAIYRIPATGGARTRLARGAIGNMAVSPNGLRVVYQQIMRNKRTDLFVVATTGGSPKNITRSATRSEFQPTWRDNATIAYARQAPKWSIFTIPRRGGKERRVTASKFNCRQPASSPDGKRLVCSTQVDGSRNLIRTFTWNGTGQKTLPIPTSKPTWPTWASVSVVTYVTN